MKRSWLGLVLLVVLLVGSLLCAWQIGRSHEPIAEAVRQAGAYAMANDWTKANALAQDARARWEIRWDFGGAFVDHAPMEEVDLLFARLGVYGKTKNSQFFAAACAELEQALKAMGESQRLSWRNLL